jgi:hypothetical protein
VNEAASKHRWSPCAVGSALPLFPTKPHRGTLLNHLIPRGNKYFRPSRKKFFASEPTPAIAVTRAANYKMQRSPARFKTAFWIVLAD